MTFGLRVWDSLGVRTFDSTEAVGGCLVDVLNITTTGVVKTYPQYAGRGCVLVSSTSDPAAQGSVDFALGYPRVSNLYGIPEYPGNYSVFIT